MSARGRSCAFLPQTLLGTSTPWASAATKCRRLRRKWSRPSGERLRGRSRATARRDSRRSLTRSPCAFRPRQRAATADPGRPLPRPRGESDEERSGEVRIGVVAHASRLTPRASRTPMMRLPKFRYSAPRTVREAVAIRADAGSESAFVAGGTDLYPNMKRRQQTPKHVIGLSRIPVLRRMRFGPEGVSIGAAVLLSAVENNRRIRRDYPGLAHAIGEISTPPLRNMGTLGGNLLLDTRCNYYDQNYEWRQAIHFCLKKDGDVCWVAPGSPKCLAVQSADSVPILIALNARAVLVSPSGSRELAVEDLYSNDGIAYLTKRPEELLTEIRLSKPDGWRGSYRKLRRRGAFDFPVLLS